MPAILQEHKDGDLYIVETAIESAQPIEVQQWWPLGLSAGNYKRNYGSERLGQAMTYSGKGTYVGEDRLQYRLRDGNATVVKYTERNPIPPPKTRLETRWNWGRWEKRTRKGWVPA